MPDKTWVDANVPTAGDFNTYFRDQVITICTSATRPASPVDGRTIYETDSGWYTAYDSTAVAWVRLFKRGAAEIYTPTWTASGTAPAINDGTISGRYNRVGRFITVAIKLLVGAGSTGGTGTYYFSLPVTASASMIRATGTTILLDSSASTAYVGVCLIEPSGTTVQVGLIGSTAIAQTSPFTWAASDRADLTITYEAAS